MKESSDHQIYLAPLLGVTDSIFRNVFEQYFGKFDYLLTPFIPTVKGDIVNPSHLRDVAVDRNDLDRVIPQIIGNDPAQFVVLANTLHAMGYRSVNWNLGCPSPQIIRKKRGSGLLPHADIIKQFLDTVVPSLHCPLSLKVRLGYESDQELLRLMPLFNEYPIQEITVHARTGIQMYDGIVNLDGFEKCSSVSRHKIIYNGDIATIDMFNLLKKRFPSVHAWMIGRGVVGLPFLLKAIRGDGYARDISQLRKFHDELYLRNSRILHGPSHLLGKMKELWSYLIQSFPEQSKLLKSIHKATKLEQYAKLIDQVFGE
jgi:tRNA-dihydrouridine synthase